MIALTKDFELESTAGAHCSRSDLEQWRSDLHYDKSKYKMIKEIQKELPRIKSNISLAKYTTFKIGGPAQYFFIAKEKKDVIEAIKMAKKNGLPFFVLGEGSNLLVSDKGFNGLVIKFQVSNFKFQDPEVVAEAGTILEELVKGSMKRGLTGLEWAAGIPGTVGGAIRGNAAAFGSSIGNLVKRVEVLKCGEIRSLKEIGSQNQKIRIFKNKDCKFSYRDSIFKKNPNLIILAVELQIEKGDKKKIKKEITKNLDYRKKNHPLNFPSAGSVFKNPPQFSAGFLIEKCGLKGKTIGQAQISKKHSNFIVNLGGAKAKDVKKLINLAKKKVKEKFGVELEEELEQLGF
ncbi:MAG: UDP-N-acetylenolpyruvoylglucosamine reductase [Candidatus Nealsonbacteria bacterium CG03_land_8_20_14_0_80_36_12]|uniref:UDP-N-acetylenolpyruvoylglucosamine reductase n=1 Tax=Candidatus Nealsonbacteria bacterium CG03_land_8_20_14_0_80_36_12 TaxID=1974701 RepID=A0A2M7BY94_9BACT|nr:MAG: UDP-N-acetylenolpyruvoylglucosamine reductase [Candidatus Nealsonbacteria bacterium CG03_land_8_20_14_0_80_36_12]